MLALMSRPATLGDLRASGWESRPVKEEIRANAVRALAEKRPLVEGIIGFEDTVLPQLANALLAGHDMIFLGERGQAKTRIIRELVGLLDEWMPIVAGSEINDDPYAPASTHARHLVADRGDDTPIEWVHRDRRYGEKLATPDTSIADLVDDGRAVGGIAGVVTEVGSDLGETPARDGDRGDAGAVGEDDRLAVGRRLGTIVEGETARGRRADLSHHPGGRVDGVDVVGSVDGDDGAVGPRERGMSRRGRCYRGETGDGAGRQERPQEATPPLAEC